MYFVWWLEYFIWCQSCFIYEHINSTNIPPILLLLLQSALQPLWVMACSTNVQYSQQEGFYRVPLPVARQTPNLEDQWFRTFQLPPPGVPHVWNDTSQLQQRKVELWAKNCREFCRKWRLPRQFWVILHAVNYDITTAWGGFEPANLGTEASTLTARPPKPLISNHYRAECINNSSHHQDTQTAAKIFIVSVKLHSHLQFSVYTNPIISQIIK